MGTPFVRAVFAVLILATIAAFFVTQQLKSEFPLVLRFAADPGDLSPNGDGFRDRTRVGFDLSEPAEVRFSIVDDEGGEVRRLVDDRRLPGDRKYRFTWDARDDDGRPVPDGIYRMRIAEQGEGRTINSFKELVVDREPPRATLESARPGVIRPGEPVRLRYRGPRNRAPEVRVFRTDDGPPRVVRRFRGNRSRSAVWDGLVGRRPAPEGSYAFTFTVRDSAGNLTVTPRAIPGASSARAGTGAAVRVLTLRGPLAVIPAGGAARFELGPAGRRRFRFALTRLGSQRVVREGRRRGGRFRVAIPRRARTGVYVLRVRAAGRRAVWPVAVAGLPQASSASGRRPLVVLPAISWQGLNPYDDDLDGFPDTLQDSSSVSLERPFAGGRMPPRFNSQVSPLMRHLDRAELGYDLTTDLALARGEGPTLSNAPGVVFAGSNIWLPPGLERRLRSHVDGGGKITSFGADAFRRSVELGRTRLSRPGRPRPTNVFGEATRGLRTSGAPLVVERDELGLFRRGDRFVGEFTRFERSIRRPRGSRLLTAAGRDSGRPAFVAYRLERGLVIRAGSPQWAAELAEGRLGVEVPRATARIWRLMSGR